MNKRVIYTAIFGGYDQLPDPTFIPEGWDFICFTDSDIKSDIWKIVKTPAIYKDPTRNARKCKLLPHRLFPEYEYSLWVDGNIIVRENVNELIEHYLDDCNLAVHDHEQNVLDPRGCVYKEAEAIFYFGQKNGNYKDDPKLISEQMNRYIAESYPSNNSLAVTMQLLRRHNEKDCIEAMEMWWEEIRYGSKRDQLSFNYSMWKSKMHFNYFSGDSRDNRYFLNTGKHKKKVKDIKIIEDEFSPIDIDYFLQMELANGGGGKEIIKQDGELHTVNDIITFFKNDDTLSKVKATLQPNNWQYFNCMLAEFRHGVENHHDLGWDKMTEEYYNSLDLMTDHEIEHYLKNTPVEFDNGYIRHNYHRACAMIGRLINGKPYIPFYMKTSQIFSEPRKQDGKHRIKPLTENVYGIQQVINLGIPPSEFTITQSGILALMGIRKNDDIDIVISSKIRNKIFNGNESFMKLPHGIEIFEKGKSKFMHFGANNEEDLINTFSFNVNGINFLQPRFYLSRKRTDRDKDKRDWDGIHKFFELERHKGYPFNRLTIEQWGYR